MKIFKPLYVSLIIGFTILIIPCFADDLHMAARQGNIAKIEALLAKNPSLVNTKGRRGFTALQIAALYGREKAVDMLIAKGADVNVRSSRGRTALDIAAIEGYKKITALLRAKGAADTIPDLPLFEGPYLGLPKPGLTPQLFAPGVVSTGLTVASIGFTPDGKELYFAKNTPVTRDLNVILCMKQVNGQWLYPEIVPFSGKYRDWNLNLSPDGKKLYYTSRRPTNENIGKGTPKKDNDIWVVEKTSAGWSEPKNLGSPINTKKMDCYAAVTRQGTLYFHGFNYEDGKGKADIYRSRLVNGHYTKPENLGDAINSMHHDWDVFVAADESYLIFASVGRPDDMGYGDLYISFRKPDGSWTLAKNMGSPVNSTAPEICPAVSADGKYLFFTSFRAGSGDLYWVDAKIIEKYKR